MSDLLCFASFATALVAGVVSGLWRYVRWLQGRVLEAESAVAHLRARLEQLTKESEVNP